MRDGFRIFDTHCHIGTALHSGVMTKLILSGVADSLFPADSLLFERFQMYHEITVELANQGKPSKKKMNDKVDKPAKLDNGVRVMVPPHIGSGTRIIVDVYAREYVRKAD